LECVQQEDLDRLLLLVTVNCRCLNWSEARSWQRKRRKNIQEIERQAGRQEAVMAGLIYSKSSAGQVKRMFDLSIMEMNMTNRDRIDFRKEDYLKKLIKMASRGDD
jgi:hypothetical protein